ncbi:MAG: sodium/proton-translocating pyrophosphatase, partial [Euryarchaeota archaeon]|nr:sodium/proton-translocating pyrophosphatase [Euryarchaeota archaeon]
MNTQTTAEILVVVSAILALGYAGLRSMWVLRAKDGDEKMRSISAAVREGAEAFLVREYRTVAIVGAVLAVL